MRLVVISDTHMLHGRIQIPDGDVLIHCGDFCNRGDFTELAAFDAWLTTLPHKHKIVIPGNHDRYVQEALTQARVLIGNATLLIDEEITIDGVRFYGSPWSPTFGYWSWMAHRGDDIAAKWAKIPEGVDVLITHGPPMGILDSVPRLINSEWDIENVGCLDLYVRVMQLRPRLHLFGHIHEGAGRAEENGIQFGNASICDGRYRPVNLPLVFDIEEEKKNK